MAFFYAMMSLIAILAVPIFLGADIYFDLSRKLLIFGIKLYGLPVIRITFSEKNNEIFYRRGRGEVKTFKNNNNNKSSMINAVIVKKVKLSMKINIGNAAITALISAILTDLSCEKIQVTCIPDFMGNTAAVASVNVITSPILGVIYGIKRIKKYA